MTPERWEQVQRLYHAARGTPVPQRAGVMAELCAGDDALREEVETLLVQTGASEFLEVPALMDALGAMRAPLVGRRLGPYAIQSRLGAGGMGEVYRARDTKLGRDVAIKVLPAMFAADPQRIRRLEGEARLLAALNHPHIGGIYGFEQVDGVHGLVLELVEGPTLADRLGQAALRGRGLPVDEALEIARQIAEALDAAHEKGIVHRDLKPANIKLTSDGTVKVLDFGLAKLAAGATPASGLSPPMGETREGTLLGTVAYMSPEQARGRPVDKRMDVWAFGCVLHEMLAGRPAFAGESLPDTLAAIVDREPDWGALPAATPSGVQRLLRRCLEKDPRRRLRDIGDAQDDLTRARDGQPIPVHGASARSRASRTVTAALSIASLIAVSMAVGFRLRSRPPPDTRPGPVRFAVAPPRDAAFVGDPGRSYLALSPDGSQLAFVAAERAGTRRLWLRSISAIEARPLSGTEGANGLFWAPDGRSLGFFVANKLKRLDLSEGIAYPLCDVTDVALSGTWGAGEILFASVEGDAIFSVPTHGGAPSVLVKADRSRGERVSWPWFLPDGRRFLYLSRLRDGSGEVTLGERGRGPRPILPAMSSVQWVDPDYLVFVREGTLVGQRFDLAAELTIGEPFFIAEPVDYFFSSARGTFATSRNGNVVYQSHQDVARLVWSSRNGTRIADVGTPGDYRSLRISPDGRTLLYARTQPGVGTPDLWTWDIGRGIETRLTSDPGSESRGVWLPKGHGVVFSADRGGIPHLFRKDLVTGAEDELLPVGQRQVADDVSPDGLTLAFSGRTGPVHFDVLALSLPTPGAPSVLAGSRFDERGLRFSPDGRTVAFLSDESGRHEVYAASFPAMAPKIRVSTGGARQPQWNPAGRELFYLTDDRHLVSVPVRAGPSLELGTPATLFALPERPAWGDFAVHPDGRRFLSVVFEVRGTEQPLTVVLDWPAEVGRR
jgi:serine/threonine protein kinase/Tol biopolymer transport system component